MTRFHVRYRLYELSILPWWFVSELNTSHYFGVAFPPDHWSWARPRLFRWANAAVEAAVVPLWWLARSMEWIVPSAPDPLTGERR